MTGREKAKEKTEATEFTENTEKKHWNHGFTQMNTDKTIYLDFLRSALGGFRRGTACRAQEISVISVPSVAKEIFLFKGKRSISHAEFEKIWRFSGIVVRKEEME